MSEYQYYEFQAIDRPLSPADQAALRDLSTRARITATSFTNDYQWGDFKGNPSKLMARYFDLHLYLANWGTRQLMIRLPKRLVPPDRFERFLRENDNVKLDDVAENLVLQINWDSEPGRAGILDRLHELAATGLIAPGQGRIIRGPEPTDICAGLDAAAA
ncbi:hypothetical protein [Rhodopila sp.]|uniref:hypothetical protein n=1 Tax=Rhodopila sp. TaxID=2480087 RepID=UPI003D0ADF44